MVPTSKEATNTGALSFVTSCVTGEVVGTDGGSIEGASERNAVLRIMGTIEVNTLMKISACVTQLAAF